MYFLSKYFLPLDNEWFKVGETSHHEFEKYLKIVKKLPEKNKLHNSGWRNAAVTGTTNGLKYFEFFKSIYINN